MKRVKFIVRSVIVLFVGIIPALGICNKISFASDGHGHATALSSAHDHALDSNHEHSENAEVHCSDVELFVPASSFSLKSDSVLERMSDPFVPVLVFHGPYSEFYRLLHGPPVFPRSNGSPSRFFFSVLRI